MSFGARRAQAAQSMMEDEGIPGIVVCSSREQESLEAAVFFDALPAKAAVAEAIDHLDQAPSNNVILVCGTGSGKTLGLSARSLVQNRKTVLILPKVVQVHLQVNRLKSMFRNRRIGFAAGSESDYTNDGTFDFIVVTYGHLLAKLVHQIANRPTVAENGSIVADVFPGYSIIFDEVHESKGDIASVLGLSHMLPNQKIITTATFHKELLETSIRDVGTYRTIVQHLEPLHPVATEYRHVVTQDGALTVHGRLLTEKVEMICALIHDLLRQPGGGRILVFLAAVSEIDRLVSSLIRAGELREEQISSVYAEMWDDEIVHAVNGSDVKVIVSTNVLESSVTIPDLWTVIDTCTKVEMDGDTLRRFLISKAEAKQRAGRVGRTRPGRVIRIMSEEQFQELDEFPKSPFALADPIECFLKVATAFPRDAAGVGEVLGISEAEQQDCVRRLQDIGALDQGAAVTEFGKRLVDIPMALQYACPICQLARPRADAATSHDGLKMLALLLSTAFVEFPRYLVHMRLELRRGERKARVEFMKEQLAPFMGDSSIETVLNIFIAVIEDANTFKDERLDRMSVKLWCKRTGLKSKYVVRVLHTVSLMCRVVTGKMKTFFSQRAGPFKSLATFEPMRRLITTFNTAPERKRALIEAALSYFEPFFQDRLIRADQRPGAVAEDAAGPSLHIVQKDLCTRKTSSVDQDAVVTVMSVESDVTVMCVESDLDAAFMTGIPPLCGALNKVKFFSRNKRRIIVSVAGLFPVRHEPLFSYVLSDPNDDELNRSAAILSYLSRCDGFLPRSTGQGSRGCAVQAILHLVADAESGRDGGGPLLGRQKAGVEALCNCIARGGDRDTIVEFLQQSKELTVVGKSLELLSKLIVGDRRLLSLFLDRRVLALVAGMSVEGQDKPKTWAVNALCSITSAIRARLGPDSPPEVVGMDCWPEPGAGVCAARRQVARSVGVLQSHNADLTFGDSSELWHELVAGLGEHLGRGGRGAAG